MNPIVCTLTGITVVLVGYHVISLVGKLSAPVLGLETSRHWDAGVPPHFVVGLCALAIGSAAVGLCYGLGCIIMQEVFHAR